LDSEAKVCAAIDATDHQAGGLHDQPLTSLRESGDAQLPPGAGIRNRHER
jgi:hypothetical protein